MYNFTVNIHNCTVLHLQIQPIADHVVYMWYAFNEKFSHVKGTHEVQTHSSGVNYNCIKAFRGRKVPLYFYFTCDLNFI